MGHEVSLTAVTLYQSLRNLPVALFCIFKNLLGGTGKVRKECVEGLQRVVALRRVQWARQVSALNLLPTSSMLTLLDKKFGGEVTKEDVQVAFSCATSTYQPHFLAHATSPSALHCHTQCSIDSEGN